MDDLIDLIENGARSAWWSYPHRFLPGVAKVRHHPVLVLIVELTEFDKNCISLLEAAPKRRSRHCFRSALHHIECAERIVAIDPEMAVFRGLTAEEEAASGFMHCLKERNYINSEKLKPNDHLHKHAIIPFVSILGSFFESFFQEFFGIQEVKPIFHIQEEEDGERRLTLGLPIVLDNEKKIAYPVPPLNFSVTYEKKRVSYRRQISSLIESQGVSNIKEYIREQANLRNKVLYAGPDGYPKISDIKAEFLELRSKRILVLLRAYLLIYPYHEIQPFVQDTLDAFLTMLNILNACDLHDEF